MGKAKQTDEDRRLVLERAIQMLRQDPKLGRITALERAQEVLPAERRMGKMAGLTQVPWAIFPDDINQARAKDVQRGKTISAAHTKRIKDAQPSTHPIPIEELEAALPPLPDIKRRATDDDTMIVRWTDAENAHVARGGAIAIHYGKAKFIGRAVEIGQQRLPTNRQRSNFWNVSAPLKALMEKERRLIQRTEQKLIQKRIDAEQSRQQEQELQASEMQSVEMTLHDAQEDAAALQRAAETPSLAAVAATPTPLTAVTTPPTMGQAIDTLTTGLRQLVSDYVAGIFTEAIDKVLADLPGRLQRALTASVPQPTAQVQQVNGHAHTQSSEVVPKHVPFVRGDGGDKLKLTKVLVVGGKRAVHAIIEGKVGHKLKLEFVEQDESAGAVKMRMGAADVVVLWTDYCSHSHRGVVKARAERYAMVEGGVNAVVDKLELIATTPIEDLAERLNIQRKPQVTTANGVVAH